MTRPLRIQYAGAVYHITSRGNEKKAVSKNDEDRRTFLNTLQHVNKRYNWICHAYCLMTNHFHLLIETHDGNLSLGMRQLNGVYTQLFNKLHGRSGHLFQGRYSSILIQKDSHLLEVCRYVVLNPVRTKMVENPEEYAWSSYRATAGREAAAPCLTIDWVLGQFNGKRSKAEAEYCKFVEWGIGKETIWREVKGQSILGEDDFVEGMISHIKKHQHVPEIPRSHRFAHRPTLDKLFTKKIIIDKIKWNKTITDAVAKYGYTQQQVAAYLGMHYSTISNLVRGKA
jgi:putative transposase